MELVSFKAWVSRDEVGCWLGWPLWRCQSHNHHELCNESVFVNGTEKSTRAMSRNSSVKNNPRHKTRCLIRHLSGYMTRIDVHSSVEIALWRKWRQLLYFTSRHFDMNFSMQVQIQYPKLTLVHRQYVLRKRRLRWIKVWGTEVNKQ